MEPCKAVLSRSNPNASYATIYTHPLILTLDGTINSQCTESIRKLGATEAQLGYLADMAQKIGLWGFKRIRFDDEVFNFQSDWVTEFAEKYPKRVGLPFEIFIEPNQFLYPTMYLTEEQLAKTPQELVDVAAGHDPYGAPGAVWHYSNTNYILLGMIVESVAGKPLAEVIRTRFLDPEKLSATSFDGAEPLHGTLAGRGAWVVLEQRADVCVAGVQLDDDPVTAAAFPFAARIQVEWRLGVDELEVTTTLFATGEVAVPGYAALADAWARSQPNVEPMSGT